MDFERLLHQLVDKENFDVIPEIRGWIRIYDSMSPSMKLCLDMKMRGIPVKEIAKVAKLSKITVYKHLERARCRFIRALGII